MQLLQSMFDNRNFLTKRVDFKCNYLLLNAEIVCELYCVLYIIWGFLFYRHEYFWILTPVFMITHSTCSATLATSSKVW